jgi:hypothetical protein
MPTTIWARRPCHKCRDARGAEEQGGSRVGWIGGVGGWGRDVVMVVRTKSMGSSHNHSLKVQTALIDCRPLFSIESTGFHTFWLPPRARRRPLLVAISFLSTFWLDLLAPA